MVTLSNDTSVAAERVQIELLRQAAAWRKFEMVAQLNQTVQVLMLEGLRQRYPNATAEERWYKRAELVLGTALASRVYSRSERQ